MFVWKMGGERCGDPDTSLYCEYDRFRCIFNAAGRSWSRYDLARAALDRTLEGIEKDGIESFVQTTSAG
ncbi:MAG: hypothetical protein OEZ06_18695 [Myxococcales bacterium]|nr:hypothetical protein [Myxococcales bacterium]